MLSDRQLLALLVSALLAMAAAGQWRGGKMSGADPTSVVLDFFVAVALILAAAITWRLLRHRTGFGPYLSRGLRRFGGGLRMPPDDSDLRDGRVLNSRKGMTGWIEHLDAKRRFYPTLTVTADGEIDNGLALLGAHGEDGEFTASAILTYPRKLRNVVQFSFQLDAIQPGDRIRLEVYSLSKNEILISSVAAKPMK